MMYEPSRRERTGQEPHHRMIDEVLRLSLRGQLGVLRAIAPGALARLGRAEREGFLRDLNREIERALGAEIADVPATFAPAELPNWPDEDHLEPPGRRGFHSYAQIEQEPGRGRRLGPRGYVRSDERIREELCERLGSSDDLDVTDVEVLVSAGVVTLIGTVPERIMKRHIEEICDVVSGIQEIHDQIRVQRFDPYAGGSGLPTEDPRADTHRARR